MELEERERQLEQSERAREDAESKLNRLQEEHGTERKQFEEN